MKVVAVSETRGLETRVALVPESCKKLVQKGVDVAIEAGAGAASGFPDHDYTAAGANIAPDRNALLASADFLFGVGVPDGSDISQLKAGAMLISSLLPIRNVEALQQLAKQQVTAFSTDAIPRTTRAQSMDTLSSMANIAGYKAVLIAALESNKYFPMFMTAAGTVFPAKVFIIGVGVAGLQAIATAKRLGATVEATDTRSVTKEQVESLGGRFVGVESDEDAQTAGGYAKELSAEFYRKQGELIAERCKASDVVITTALIGGVKAPKLITADTVRNMKPGAVIVDLAAEAGGNCELTRPGETRLENGVKICAPLNLPATMPFHGSTLYSRNLTTFFLEFWKDNAFNLNLEDEIITGAMVTHGGDITHKGVKEALANA
ncbi:MAG: Re/Si-specific NAD(P)(+) transhydrogenase subunit alpha [Phycisphaerae bacterium]